MCQRHVCLTVGETDLEKILPKDSNTEAAKTDKDDKSAGTPSTAAARGEEGGSNGVRVALESLTTHDSPGAGGSRSGASAPVPMETQDGGTSASVSSQPASTNAEQSSIKDDPAAKKEAKKLSPLMEAKLKHIKPLLNATSRLGKALSELFGLLVKLSVGSPFRQRRAQTMNNPTVPSAAARTVAGAVTKTSRFRDELGNLRSGPPFQNFALRFISVPQGLFLQCCLTRRNFRII